ncbi:hypothetical protein AgCh_027168 [Apium graveolens]
MIRFTGDVPEEMVTNILLRLDAKTLVGFKSVSKTWLALISSPHFAKSHLEITEKQEEVHIVHTLRQCSNKIVGSARNYGWLENMNFCTITFDLNNEVLKSPAINYPVRTFEAKINNYNVYDARATITSFNDSIAVIISKQIGYNPSGPITLYNHNEYKINLWALDDNLMSNFLP